MIASLPSPPDGRYPGVPCSTVWAPGEGGKERYQASGMKARGLQCLAGGKTLARKIGRDGRRWRCAQAFAGGDGLVDGRLFAPSLQPARLCRPFLLVPDDHQLLDHLL